MTESGKRISGTRKVNRGPSAGPENRRALIAAAREVFAADGLNAPFNAVAKKAGVGQGSLYRHFPDRVALAIAVFDENLDELEAAVAAPDATLSDLMDDIIEQALVSTAFIDLIWNNQHDERVAHIGARLTSLAERLLVREHAAGRIGEHVEAADVLLAISMLADVLARSAADERKAVAERARTMFRNAFAPR
ncbi:TetR/AcrR family transcriptional regulator [Agromyces sp. SYSU K20354]|uniref:TetR/AcrR family transcriptional regulator n=1 Tax=Agromyces cavernae TaxID=2898659 RepID=UPI001E4A0D2A|nr:TetR/AcrR family transcriptional regulator [Agromyces cavernae]MCD2440796.1 TetR/AcrR family transcriptional regulator [Agromyces cavernae]